MFVPEINVCLFRNVVRELTHV